jgi:Domain of unknown function (DUF4160)
MPELSRFFGIVIYMYYKDHVPPHFHAFYQEHEAQVSIETGNIIAGDLPNKQTRLVQAWVELHRDELMFNYRESMNDGKFKKIKPLD